MLITNQALLCILVVCCCWFRTTSAATDTTNATTVNAQQQQQNVAQQQQFVKDATPQQQQQQQQQYQNTINETSEAVTNAPESEDESEGEENNSKRALSQKIKTKIDVLKNVAAGTQPLRLAGCRFKSGDAKNKFVVTSATKGSCHLGRFYDSYIKNMLSGDNALTKMTKGLIGNPEDFLLMKDGVIEITPEFAKITNLHSPKGSNVLPWLTIKEVVLSSIVFAYDDASDEDPLDIEIIGNAIIKFPSGQSYKFDIRKPKSTPDDRDSKETDVELQYAPATPTESINVEAFLKFTGGADLNALYSESANFETFLALKKLSVRKTRGVSLIKILLMGQQTWDAFLYGKPVAPSSGNRNLYREIKEIVFYCKSTIKSTEEKTKICAMAALFENPNMGFLKAKHPFVSDEVVDELVKIPLIKNANQAGLFLSREGIEFPNLDKYLQPFSSLKTVKDNSDKRFDIYEGLAINGLCFRFRDEKTSKELSFQETYENALLVHACIGADGGVKIGFPENWHGNKLQYANLEKMAFFKAPPPNIGFDSDAIMELVTVSVGQTDAGNVETCQEFKPADKIQLVRGGAQLDGADDQGFKKLYLRNTVIKQCYVDKAGSEDNEKEWVIKGSGYEILWELETKVEIVQLKRRVGIVAYMNIHSVSDIMQRAGTSIRTVWFKKAFPEMGNFPVKEIRTEIYFNKKNVALIKGRTDLAGMEHGLLNFKYFHKHGQTHLALCMFKQNMELHKVLERMFKNSVTVKWDIYEEGSIILRPHAHREGETPFEAQGSCRVMEKEAEKFRVKDDTGYYPAFTGGMLVKAYGLHVDGCSVVGSKGFSHVCHFLWKANAKKPVLPVTYFGQVIEGTSFRMDGRFPEQYEMQIGAFKLLGTGRENSIPNTFPREIIHQRKIVKSGNKDRSFDTVSGYLQVGRAPMPARLMFVGDRVLLAIVKTDTTRRTRQLYNYFPMVKFVHIHKEQEDITDSNLTYLEMDSQLRIGTSMRLRAVTVTSKQYLYPDYNKNRFWGCIPKRVFLRQLFEMFKYELKNSILSDAHVTGCFTYHTNEEKAWKIEHLSIEAKAGLRFYGMVEGYKNIEIKIDSESIEMEMVLNPIKSQMKFDSTSNNEDPLFDNLDDYIDTKTGESALDFYSLEQDFNKGPTLRVSFGKGPPSYTLKGYIFMIGYRGEAVIDMLPTQGCTGTDCEFNFYRFDNLQGSSGKQQMIYGEITGDLALTGECDDCKSFNDINFSLKIDLTNAQQLQPSTRDIVKVADLITKELDLEGVNKNIDELEEVLGKMQTTHSNNRRRTYIAEKHTQIAKLKRSRAIQATKKTCIDECPAVKMPGFTTKDCYKTRQGNQARCLSYSPNQFASVSNVGCLSKCESEKVMSFVKAKSMDHKYKIKLASLEKHRDISKRSSRAERSANSKSEKPNFKAYSTFLEELRNVQRRKATLQITKMVSDNQLKVLESPDCLPFKVSYHLNTDNEEFSRTKTDESMNICFNGEFAEDAYHKIIENAYKEELEQLVAYISNLKITVEDTIDKMQQQVADILTKREEITSIPSKIWNVDTNSMSPLKTSSFHVQDPSTVAAFTKNSPWVLMENTDPFVGMKEIHVRTNASFQEPHANDACAVSRDSIEKIQGITKYVKRWLQSHQENKGYLEQVKSYVNGELTQMKQFIGQIRGNKTLHQFDAENMNHWSDITVKGMAKWMEMSTGQMKELETTGPHLMKNEVMSAFVGDANDSLESYVGRTIKKGSDAYTRMNIPSENEDFSNISTELLQLFKDGTTLTEMSTQVEKVEQSLKQPDKRTLSCSMKI